MATFSKAGNEGEDIGSNCNEEGDVDGMEGESTLRGVALCVLL